MAYKIEWGDNCVHIKYNGDVNISELFSVTAAISGDLRYRLLKRITVNFLEIKSYKISESDIKHISILNAIPSILNPNIKLSVVSNNNEIQEMVLKYIDFMKANEWEIKLFDNIEESMEWGKLK